MYSSIEEMLQMPELTGARIQITHVQDRFQRSISDAGCKDMLRLIRVNGFVYELQLNTRRMVEQKEGHKDFEQERLAHDDVILATMLNNHDKSKDAVTRAGGPNSARDMYGLGPSLYSQFHWQS